MTDFKICPICSTENSIKLDKCQNCGFSLLNSQPDNTDWLDNLRSENNEHETPNHSTSHDKPFDNPQNSISSNKEDLPDWLAKIRENKETEENFNQIQENNTLSSEKKYPFTENPEFKEKKDQNESESAPDWLSPIRNENDNKEAQSPRQTDQDLPDWLSGSSNEEVIKSNEEDSLEEDLPDWLINTANKTEINDFENIKPEHSEPDWLQDIDELNQETEVEEPAQEETRLPLPNSLKSEPMERSEFLIPPFSDLASDSATKENPIIDESTVNEQINSESEFPEEMTEKPEAIYPADENQPDKEDIEYDPPPFLNEETAFSLQQTSNQSAQPFTLDDMPDWLEDIDKVKNDELEETTPTQTQKTDKIVQPGSLPNWLKAMRPISAVAPSEIHKEDRKKIEKSGPLAGLQGVLSSETAINLYTPPPTYASKVNVTEKNKLHVQLLEDVFSRDKTQKSKTQSKSGLDYTIIRLIIPILLIVVLLFSSFNNKNIEDVSNSTRNMPAVQFASIANSLSTTLSDAPRILVVMDSDAASMGELELITQTAFETFMIQNSWLVFIGTNPSGLIVSDQMTTRSKQIVPSYNEVERIINLGYLPGNETGIQSFISSPKLMMQQVQNGTSVWENPGLKYISQINDFDSLWIISDNAESTQKWIEQLHSSSFNKPILISATTQATPMLTTYLKADQFDGLIGGLQGAATYDQLTSKTPNSFNQTWNLYRALIFVFLLIILAGAVFQIIEAIFRSRNK